MSTRNAGNAQEETRSTQRPPRPQSKKWPRLLDVLCELPPPLGLVLPELRRGSPTSLRQGYGRPPQRGCRVGDPGRPPQRGCRVGDPGGPPKLQQRRKRLRREGGCVQTLDFFTRCLGGEPRT